MTINRASPFRDGFHALMHDPLLLGAELMWRWCFGLSAWVLGILSILLFLDSLKLSPLDLFLLRTLQPQLWERALRHIFTGSLARFLLELAGLLIGVLLLWSLAATVGRAATLSRLVAMFGTSHDEEIQPVRWTFPAIFLLQLLRAAWLVIAFSVAGGLLLYGFVMAQREHALRAALALSFGFACACLVGITLNWLLGVSPLFCVRNGASAREALDEAIGFSSRYGGRLSLLGFGFFLLRLVWAAIMWFAFLSPAGWAAKIGGGWTLLLMGLIALVYFAGVDLLNLVRLASYVALLEDGSEPFAEEQPAPPEIMPFEGLA
jgi:hypothetical protein